MTSKDLIFLDVWLSAAVVLCCLTADAAVAQGFVVGGWTGSPVSDPHDGPDGCSMTQPVEKGTLFVVHLSRDLVFSLGMRTLNWNFSNDWKGSGQVLVDQAPPVAVIGTAFGADTIMFSAPQEGLLRSLFEHGTVLRLEVGDGWAQIGLQGSKAAVAQLAACSSRLSSDSDVGSFPSEFRGVWNLQNAGSEGCVALDWEKHENDSLLRVTSGDVEFWEGGCQLKTIRASDQANGGDSTISLALSCSGEGEDWASSQTWSLLEVGSKLMTVDSKTLRTDTYEKCRGSISKEGQRFGDFPLASCGLWNGTATDVTGRNTSAALMKGRITRFDIEEYCERDFGGVTHGENAKVDECVKKKFEAQKTVDLFSRADCVAGTLEFSDGRETQKAKFPLIPDADTSCASGMPPLVAQFQILCPTATVGQNR